MPRLTKRHVDGAPSKATPYFLWCSELPGFGVRIFPTGKRVYYADYYNVGGARKRMSIGAHGKVTTEEARKLAIGILGAVVKGDDPAEERATGRKSITVAELCDRYLAAAERGLIMGKRGLPKKASTIYVDVGRIARHIVPLLGGKRVRDLVAADINRFIRDVADGKTAIVEKTANKRGKAVVEGGLGTAARTAGLLGGILSFAVSEGIRSDNPARGVRRPADRRRKRRLSAEEYRALGKALVAAQGGSWQVIAAVELLALTGCRPGEIINLKWSEVDRESRCLRLHDSKEGASTRPLGEPALAVLGALSKSAGEIHVFPAVRRGQGAFGSMARGWRRLMQHAGLQGVSPVTLRHSFASVADDLGFTRATVKTMLGHSTSDVTDGYIHKLDPVLAAAADRVASTIHSYLTERQSDAGRPVESDGVYLWEMAMLRLRNPQLSHRQAASMIAEDRQFGHSHEAFVERLRRKYRRLTEQQLEPAALRDLAGWDEILRSN